MPETRSTSGELQSAQVKAEANVKARKSTESGLDYIIIEDSPKLQLRGKKNPEWNAAINAILKERDTNITMTQEPHTNDKLAVNNNRNVIVLMKKTIDSHFLPLVFNPKSEIKTDTALTE